MFPAGDAPRHAFPRKGLPEFSTWAESSGSCEAYVTRIRVVFFSGSTMRRLSRCLNRPGQDRRLRGRGAAQAVNPSLDFSQPGGPIFCLQSARDHDIFKQVAALQQLHLRIQILFGDRRHRPVTTGTSGSGVTTASTLSRLTRIFISASYLRGTMIQTVARPERLPEKSAMPAAAAERPALRHRATSRAGTRGSRSRAIARSSILRFRRWLSSFNGRHSSVELVIRSHPGARNELLHF